MGAALIAAPPAASAAGDLGGLLGGLSGGGNSGGSGGSGSPQKPPPPPPGSAESQTPQTLDHQPRNPLVAPESKCPGQGDPGLPATAEERAMACMLSYARVAKGLPALRLDKPLQVAANHKARDVRRCQKLVHTACGRSAFYWVAREGFLKGSWIVGEMLAVEGGDSATARGTLGAWLNSKEHRGVLLHSKFDLVGIGTVATRFHGSRGMRVWVAELGYRH